MHSLRLSSTSRPKRLIATLADKTEKPIPGQLSEAQQEIALLRMQNKVLSDRVVQLEQQKLHSQLLQEELSFRTGEQANLQSLLAHYQEINCRLSERLQGQNKELPTTAPSTHRDSESFEADSNSIKNFRSSRAGRSDSCEQKENHAITPKSRVQLDLKGLLDDQLAVRKRVFL